MKCYKFKPDLSLPLVTAQLRGKHFERRVTLVIDTGAAVTQFNTPIIDFIGYSAGDAEHVVSALGPAGPMQEGYALHVDEICVLGKSFRYPLVAAYDYEDGVGAEIDGLLGFDLIKQFHLELNGPAGELRVFND